jgi:hypothetical protein
MTLAAPQGAKDRRSLNDGLNLARNHMVHTPIREPSLQPLRRAARATARYTRRIALGATDESHRLWLREDEVKYLLRNSSRICGNLF